MMPSKDTERWERLSALGVKREIPTPEGEAKMSAVILQLAEPLMKQHGTTAERAEVILTLTIAGWKKSMFPRDRQPLVEKDLIDAFVPKDGSAEAIGLMDDVMDTISQRRQKLFPDFRKVVVDSKVAIGGGRPTLDVTSAPTPDLGK
jgi:hypothetical protein